MSSQLLYKNKWESFLPVRPIIYLSKSLLDRLSTLGSFLPTLSQGPRLIVWYKLANLLCGSSASGAVASRLLHSSVYTHYDPH